MTTGPAASAIITATDATAVHVAEDDTFSVTIRCHDASGELFRLAVTRLTIRVSGYEANAVLALG